MATYAEFNTTKVKLSGGTFKEIVSNGSNKLADLLAEGAAYYGASDNQAVTDDKVESLENVKVVSHTHNGGTDGKGICSICGKQMAASLTVGGTTSWYATFASAVEAANAADGAKTITLYQDVDGYVNRKWTTYELTHGPVTLATGGKGVYGVDLIAKDISLTVTGSNGGFYVTVDGKDAELTVNDGNTKLGDVTAKTGGKLLLSNGTFNRVAVMNDGSSASLSGGSSREITSDTGYVKPYALLAKGYAYKRTNDNKWLSNANSISSKVTVEKAPFAVEKFYPNSDTDYTGSSAFATDGNIMLTAVIAPETEDVTYTYWWELFNESNNDWTTRFGDVNTNTATHTGGQSKTLTISGLPTDKSYQHRFFVWCSNGYQCYSEPFTVTRHQHSWTYTASGATITAMCSKCNTSGGSVTINKPAHTTYGDGHEAAATVTSTLDSSITAPATITYTKDGTPLGTAPTNADTYTASITLGDQSVSVQYTIDPKPITVTVDAVSRTYGDTNPAFTATAPSGALVGSDTVASLGLTLTSTAIATSNVGTYDVTGTASNGNYAVTIYGTNKLTVTAKPITVTVDPATRAYGDENPAFTATAPSSALVGNDTVASLNLTLSSDATTTSPAGTYNVTGSANNANYIVTVEGSQKLTVTKKELTVNDLAFADRRITREYDGKTDAAITVQIKGSAKVKADDVLPTVTGICTYNSKDVKDANKVTFVSAKTESANYILPAGLTMEHEASITKRVITIKSVTTTPKQFDGDTTARSCITDVSFDNLVNGETLTKSGIYNGSYVTGDYGITGTVFNSANVNEANTITGIVGIINNRLNYTFVNAEGEESSTASFTTNGKIVRADGRSLGTVDLTQKYTDISEHTYTPDWAGLPARQDWTFSSEASIVLPKQDFAADGNLLTYAISGGKAGDKITITLKASCNNYEDFTITLTITLTGKDNQQALRITGDTTVVYGQVLQLGTNGGSGTGAVTYAVTNGTGEATIDATGKLTPVKVGTVKVKATKAGDASYNSITSAEVEITITRATPTGAPKYTAITTSGKTLADAGLTTAGSTLNPNAGTLVWVDNTGTVLSDTTAVAANTTYKWLFTPTDANYTTLTGFIELYHKSSSSGGGWYYTYYTIKATAGTNGSISPSGWTSVRDGRDQTFTITPDKGYAVAKVLVDSKSVGAVKSYTFKNVTKDHTIEAIFMKSNGNPQTGVFVDVAEGSYYEEAIDWAVEKGITNGVISNMFAPSDPCTRAQIVTFLWRAAGSPAPKSMSSFTDVPADAFYAKAVAWAVENGITSGTGEGKFSPNSTCTRAQAVTFLYRASGSPAVSGKAEFSDVSTTAFYADAVAWAAKKGITTGIGGGLFGSDNDCTHGQIVTFLWRAMAE